MNLEEVLRETPMETLERVRQRLRQESASNDVKEGTPRAASNTDARFSGATSSSTESVPAALEMDLAAILEAAGVDTTHLPRAAINLDRTERDGQKKSVLTLSSLECPVASFPFIDIDSIDEPIMHLTAVPVKKAAFRRSTPPTTRSFTSLGTAVSEILKKVSLESPQVYFQTYTTLKMPSVSDCVEDNL